MPDHAFRGDGPPSEPLFFESLTIEAFRGFRDRATIPLDANSIVVSGPNGTGKTSFFDAVMWLLTGDVPRLHAVRRERDEYIVNKWAQQDNREARVMATLRVGTSSVEVSRTGSSGSSVLTITEGTDRHVGSAAAARLVGLMGVDELGLTDTLLNSALLQQDVLRHVIRKDTAMFAHLSKLLGLGVIEEFVDAAKEQQRRSQEHTKSLAARVDELRSAYQNKVEAFRTLEQQVAQSLPSNEELFAQSISETAREASLIGFEWPTASSISSGGNLGWSISTTNRLARESADLMDELHSMRFEKAAQDRSVESVERELEPLTQTVHELKAGREQCEAKLRVLRAHHGEMAQLVALVLPMLEAAESSAHCPVCEQSIDQADTAQKLRARLPSSAEDSELVRELDNFDSRLAEVNEAVVKLQSELQHAGAREQERLTLRRSVMRLLERLATFLDSVAVGETSAPSLTGEALRSMIDSSANPESVIESNKDVILERLISVGDASLRINRHLVSIADTISRVEALDRRRSELGRLQAEVETAKEELRSAEERYEQAQQEFARSKTLADAAGTALVDVVRSRFATLEPLIIDIYGRLDPHPAFKEMGFALNYARSRGTTVPVVRDGAFQLEADPNVVMSSAQANIAALAVFLSLGWASRDAGLPFLMLDDPLQSMDDVNVLGFADLTRILRRTRQLVLATHDRRFAALLERKLTPTSEHESTMVIEFSGWSRSGPIIDVRRLNVAASPGTLSVIAS